MRYYCFDDDFGSAAINMLETGSYFELDNVQYEWLN